MNAYEKIQLLPEIEYLNMSLNARHETYALLKGIFLIFLLLASKHFVNVQTKLNLYCIYLSLENKNLLYL